MNTSHVEIFSLSYLMTLMGAVCYLVSGLMLLYRRDLRFTSDNVMYHKFQFHFNIVNLSMSNQNHPRSIN